jgi:diguanylate cyclase (GGDEF)-like protein
LLFLAEAESAVGDHLAMNAALAATFLLSLSIMQMLVRQTDELADLALSDPLTGAYNRRYLLPQARRHLADYQRYARLSAMLLIDIDHFKEINDELGHFAGDGALRALVDLIDTRIRGVDTLFRLGGEEFVVLLSEVGAESAHRIAEELRSRIASANLLPDRMITVSIGVCDVTVADSAEDWVHKADVAMYDAKRAGRNRVEVVRASLGGGAEVDGSIPMWR